MKLQRNNKYARRITAGLGALVVSLGILTGCNNSNGFLSKEDIAIERMYDGENLKDSLRDPNYFSNYYMISDEEVEKRLENINIKNPDEIVSLGDVGTLVLKDKNDCLKVIQTREYRDFENHSIMLYDLFTGDLICNIDSTYMNYNIGNFDESNGKYISVKASNFIIENKNLKDYEVLEYGNPQYIIYFLANHFNDLINNYGPKVTTYSYDIGEPNDYLFGGEEKLFKEFEYSIKKIAINYAKNVPIEFQIPSKYIELEEKDSIKDNIYDFMDYEKDNKMYDLYKNLEDPNYLTNYFNISNNEISNRLERLDIKNPEKVITLNKVGTLLLKDKFGGYKVVQVSEYYDYENGNIILCDLFTEEVLCQIDKDDLDHYIGSWSETHGKYINVTPDMFTILNDSLNDYEIIEYGTIQYAYDFVLNHFDEIIYKYGNKTASYSWNNKDQNDYLFKDELDKYYSEISRTIYELACNYVKNVPYEFQIESKDLNLSSSKEEYKYNNHDITNEELQNRISKLEIINENDVVDIDNVVTLVLKNSNNEPKILLAFSKSEDGKIFKLYDLFTNVYLCDFNLENSNNIQYSKNDRLIGYDEKDFSNKSEILDNYYIEQIGLYDYSLSYVVENIDYFRNRDGIDYKIMSDPIYEVLPNGKEGVSMSIEKYAEAYVTYTPEELQISCKELSNSNDKTLIKK